jgi:hypothetical protein
MLISASFAGPAEVKAIWSSAEGFYYSNVNGKATVHGCVPRSCSTGDLEIPGLLNGLVVASIGDDAFSSSFTTLDSVVFPDTIEDIGARSFTGNRLTSVTIPNSVTSIGELAFYDNSLTAVTIPNQVVSIGRWAFKDNSLSSVVLGSAVLTIGVSAFSGNELSSVVIPNSVVAIGDQAFYANNLRSAVVGDSVEDIGVFAFSGPGNDLQTLVLGKSVKSIADYAFMGSLSSLVMPDTVTTIGTFAFANNQLTSLSIPNSVVSIGGNAFYQNAIASLALGKALRVIGHQAFAGNELTSVTIPASVQILGDASFADNQVSYARFFGNSPGWICCTSYGSPFTGNPQLTSVTRTFGTFGWSGIWNDLAVVIAPQRPEAIFKPLVVGRLGVGKTLQAAKGTWAGYPTPTFRYQWYVCTKVVTVARTTVPSTCKRITGATRSTFKLTSAQRGKYVAVLVTGTSLGTTSTSWLSRTTAKAN